MKRFNSLNIVACAARFRGTTAREWLRYNACSCLRTGVLSLAAFLALAAAPFAAQGFQSSDATYHQKAGPKASTPAKPAEPAGGSVSYPKSALTKIEILPASIAIRWPALQPAAGGGGNFCRWASGGLDRASADRQFRRQNCGRSTKTTLCSRRADGHATIAAAVEGHRASALSHCEGLFRRSRR